MLFSREREKVEPSKVEFAFSILSTFSSMRRKWSVALEGVSKKVVNWVSPP